MKQNKDAKTFYKERMQLAIENFKQAELEGAAKLAPSTYSWAKQKIYDDKKVILQYLENDPKTGDAIDDASAAAAKLLSIVRRQNRIGEEKTSTFAPEQLEQESIKNLVNEGGPAR